MWDDNQAIDLFVTVVCQRKHSPIVVPFACANLDASYDSIGAGRGRYLNSVAFRPLHFRSGRQVDSGCIEPHVHRFHGARARNEQQHSDDHNRYRGQTTRHRQNKTPARGIPLPPGPLASPTVKIR
jgi:hypothetical protein